MEHLLSVLQIAIWNKDELSFKIIWTRLVNAGCDMDRIKWLDGNIVIE